jgi:glycosyltransferase involved in cell wall biosynthesis
MTDRPLRFCMITSFYPPYNFGGDGIFVHRLSNALAEQGHEVEVIHCIDSFRIMGGCESSEGYHDHPRVTVHGIKSKWGFISPLATQQTGFPLCKAGEIQRVLQRSFDVIHYHNISLIGGPQVLTYGRGIKLYTMHEYWLACATHGLFRFNRAVCVHPWCFPCSLAYHRPPPLWRYGNLIKTAAKQVDAFIAPSRFVGSEHRRRGLDIPITHIPHFVPEEERVTGGPGAGREEEISRARYFLFVGRLEKVKGLQTLIPIFRKYDKADLLIAGKGSYETHLRRLAHGSRNIRFLGHQSGHQLRALYENAVALIVPSVCLEVFALSIIEAFREKTPVIARNIGGMPELVQESDGGFIYDTEQELVAAMDQLLADPSLRQELGQRGYSCYQRQWTMQVHLQRYFALIQEISMRKRWPASPS